MLPQPQHNSRGSLEVASLKYVADSLSRPLRLVLLFFSRFRKKKGLIFLSGTAAEVNSTRPSRSLLATLAMMVGAATPR